MTEYIYDIVEEIDKDHILLRNTGKFIIAPNLFEKLSKIKVKDMIIYSASPDGIIGWFKKVDKRNKLNLEMSKGNYEKILEYEVKRTCFKNELRFKILKELIPVLKNVDEIPKLVDYYNIIAKRIFDVELYKRDKNEKKEQSE